MLQKKIQDDFEHIHDWLTLSEYPLKKKEDMNKKMNKKYIYESLVQVRRCVPFGYFQQCVMDDSIQIEVELYK
jgi:hypothetical protein